MKERTIIIKKALLYSIVGVIGLLLFDYFRDENSSIIWYVLNGVVFFIVVALKDLFWDDFVPFLEDSQKNATKDRDSHLKEIYSKRSVKELENMISNSSIAKEVKEIAQEILIEKLKINGK